MSSFSELCEQEEDDDDFLSESSYSPRSHNLSITTNPIITRITTFLFVVLETIISILTLSYNLYWHIYISNIPTPFLSSKPIPSFISQSMLSSCDILFQWKRYIILWCKINLTKTIVFFCTVKFCCGNQTDLNIPCIVLRSLISLIPSIVFVLKLPKVVEGYAKETGGVVLDEEVLCKCEELNYAIEVFNYYEGFYCYLIGSIIGGIILIFGLVFIKEVWKTRNYIQI